MSKNVTPNFKKSIENIRKSAGNVKTLLHIAEKQWESQDAEGAYNTAFELAEVAEHMALTSRVLPAYTGHPSAVKDLKKRFIENAPVTMGFTPEGWFCLILPALLPKKAKGNAAYLRDMIYPVADNFFRRKPQMRYTDCTLIFRHVYNKRRPEREYRDHDNIEIKAVTDIISYFILHDDSALRCQHFYCSASGDEDCTQVFVVPQREFINWINGAKKYQNKAVVLHERIR